MSAATRSARTRSFLEPYNIAQLLGGSAQSTLRKYLLGYPELLAHLRDLNAAIDGWRATVAEPIIAQVQAGDETAAAGGRGTGGTCGVRPDPGGLQRAHQRHRRPAGQGDEGP